MNISLELTTEQLTLLDQEIEQEQDMLKRLDLIQKRLNLRNRLN